MAQAGVRVVRLDFSWAQLEPQKGLYSWTAMDALTQAIQQRGMRPQIILGGSHPLYSGKRNAATAGITDPTTTTVFVRFATLAVQRYPFAIFELWNEPNHPLFWQPKLNVQQYIVCPKRYCRP